MFISCVHMCRYMQNRIHKYVSIHYDMIYNGIHATNNNIDCQFMWWTFYFQFQIIFINMFISYISVLYV